MSPTPGIPVYLAGDTDQPASCPQCGARTDWIDGLTPSPEGWPCQLHTCLAAGCGYRFELQLDGGAADPSGQACPTCGAVQDCTPDCEHRAGRLDPDAPPVPPGLRARPGVEYGCGQASCTDCYEPV